MHRRRLDQTAFGFAFVKTCVAHVRRLGECFVARLRHAIAAVGAHIVSGFLRIQIHRQRKKFHVYECLTHVNT